jgi:hypothetical protein
MGAVEPKVTTVRAWNGTPERAKEPFPQLSVPLAGFSIIEAENLDEAVDMVAKTPCARAKGAIEVRPIMILEWTNLTNEKASASEFRRASRDAVDSSGLMPVETDDGEGRPSRWNTLRALRVLRWYEGVDS